MPFQIIEYSKCTDKKRFIDEFIHHPIESMYFNFYKLEHDFILIKSNDQTLLKFMICITPHSGMSYFGLFSYDTSYVNKDELIECFKKYLADWNKLRNLNMILGPINFSTWLSYRLPSFSDGGPQFSFEPKEPFDYVKDLKRIGFKTHKTYSSKGFGLISQFITESKSAYDQAISNGLIFEFLPKVLSEKDIEELYHLSIVGFDKNYLATPIDLITFKNLYKIGNGVNDFSNSLLVKSNSGSFVGFFICFIEKEHAICKTIAIHPKCRGQGLSNALFHQALLRAQSSGVSAMVSAMVIEEAQSESYGKKMTLKWTHLYEILEYLT